MQKRFRIDFIGAVSKRLSPFFVIPAEAGQIVVICPMSFRNPAFLIWIPCQARNDISETVQVYVKYSSFYAL